MLLLHAGLLDETLVLWAEASLAGDQAGEAPASLAQLAASLACVTGPDPAERARRCDGIVAWLPGVDGRVTSSSSLFGERQALDGAHELVPQAVNALAFDVPSSLALLTACDGRTLLAPGIAVGHDLAFWSRALRFAAALVVAQRYVPSLDVERHGRATAYRASWRARLGATQRAELAALAGAMPGACRALSRAADGAPDDAPFEVVRRFVNGAVDALVRSAALRARASVASDGTLNDRWMRALCGEQRVIDVKGVEAREFASAVEEWVREATRDDEAEHRLCLRLEEPVTDGGPWFVRYLLQSHADLSLLVSFDSVWKKPPLRRAFLDAMGKAARLSPRIDATLREAKPLGYALDDAGAHAFLTADAPLLGGAGVGVLLPAWWTPYGTKTRIAARAEVKRQRGPSSGMRLDSIVEVNWRLALGGEPLSPKELAELARLKSPLVRMRGQWVIVGANEIRAALELRERRSTQTMRLGEVVHMALTGRGQNGALAVEHVAGTGALGKLFDRLAGRAAFEEQVVPKSLRGTLRPYQVRGYSWLRFLSRLGLGACLADDMGLGKSITTLALVARDWEEDPTAPVLLVCPTSVIGNWQREIARFTPKLPVLVHHGGERTRGGRLLPAKARVALVLTSYGLMLRDLELLRTVRWRGVVLDEAQNVKNGDSKQAQAARALDAAYRVALTGTPIENHVGDLWSLMEFLNRGLLGTPASFRREFLIPISALADSEAEARLKRTTAPFVLRRLKSDRAIIADLPKKLEMRVFCQLTKEQASLYAAVLRDVDQRLEETEGIERRGLILATITKLKQVCNHPVNLLRDNSRLGERSGKLARLAEMLDEVHAEGERALVFTQFTEMASLLRSYLQETTGREVLYLHGGLPKRQRDQIVDRFQSADNAPGVFILSLRAGGTGLNLTRANHVFHFDRWWNPAVENQASDRAYRIGQTKSVYVHRLVCAGTIEDKIDALLARKSAVANRLVRSGEAGLTDLSNAQLRELFALQADAVAGA
jgi:superfamily II DNA or RNA helicase